MSCIISISIYLFVCGEDVLINRNAESSLVESRNKQYKRLIPSSELLTSCCVCYTY